MDNTRVRQAAQLAGLLSSLVVGCAPSLQTNIGSVRALSHVRQLPALKEGRIELDTGKEVQEVLQKPVDSEAAIRIALLNNRELRARLRELGISAGQLMQAGLVANPTFEVEILPERDSAYELRADYEITSLIMAPLRRRAQQHEMEAARYDVAGAVVQLGYDVRTSFYALQAAAQRLTLAQRMLDALAASRDAAVALLQAGNQTQFDTSSQIAGYERARVSVAKIELEVAERREEMQRILGLYGEQTEWQVAATLAPVPVNLTVADDLERHALEANLELRAAQDRLKGLAKRSGIARTQAWLPEINADVHALRTKKVENPSEREWRWSGGASMQVPLFDRGQGRLRSIEAQFDALMERSQGLAISLRSAAREARNRLASAHARARQYQDVIVPAQTTVMEQAVLQYNAMQLGVFQLLQARREQLDVELAYVDTLREYWSAMAEVEALTQGRVVHAEETPSASAFDVSAETHGGH